MDRRILILATILGVAGIIFGAFGAHSLKEILQPESLAVFETGVKYQMYHSLFLLFIGITTSITEKAKRTIFWLVLVGVIFFSGSIYLLACDAILPFSFKKFGFITPIGGLLLISAWIVLLLKIIRKRG